MTEELMVTIRAMEASDAPQVAAIEQQSFSQPWSEDAFANAATDMNYIYIVAEAENEIIGYAGCTVSYNEADITNIAVMTKYHRRGIAGQMLDTLFRLAKQREVTDVFLEVRESNVPAISLYEGKDFETLGKRPAFYKLPTEDALIMKKTLVY